MEKYCKFCDTTKPVELFYKRKASKDGYQSRCKSCDDKMIRKYTNNEERRSYLSKKECERYYKHKDGLNHVYICTDINYAGTTDNTKWRSNSHHAKKGAKKEFFRVIYSDKSREACLELEELLHDLGYEGRHSKNMYR